MASIVSTRILRLQAISPRVIAAAPSAPASSTTTIVTINNDVPKEVALVYGATISVDISTGSVFDLTLTGDATLNFTGGSADLNGKKIMLRLTQDATGSRLVTWGTGAHFGTDIPSITLTTTGGAEDYIGVVYRHATTNFEIVAYSRGF